jgi:hypothetical protein
VRALLCATNQADPAKPIDLRLMFVEHRLTTPRLQLIG